jgi:hypothetical protein
MQQHNNFTKLAASILLLAITAATGNAFAGQGQISFTANIKTNEFMLPAPTCSREPLSTCCDLPVAERRHQQQP